MYLLLDIVQISANHSGTLGSLSISSGDISMNSALNSCPLNTTIKIFPPKMPIPLD